MGGLGDAPREGDHPWGQTGPRAPGHPRPVSHTSEPSRARPGSLCMPPLLSRPSSLVRRLEASPSVPSAAPGGSKLAPLALTDQESRQDSCRGPQAGPRRPLEEVSGQQQQDAVLQQHDLADKEESVTSLARGMWPRGHARPRVGQGLPGDRAWVRALLWQRGLVPVFVRCSSFRCPQNCKPAAPSQGPAPWRPGSCWQVQQG